MVTEAAAVFYERVRRPIDALSWWGNAASEGFNQTIATAKYASVAFTTIGQLSSAKVLDPLVFTIGVPNVFGFTAAAVIPYHVYELGDAVFNCNEPLKVRAFKFIQHVGEIGVALGAVLQAVSLVWEHTRPLFDWLPPFQIISATLSTLNVGRTIFELHRLNKLNKALESCEKTPSFTPYSAERYLGVPLHDFEKFSEILEKEPDGGLSMLKGRVKEKLTEQKLKVAAGVISVVALVILTALTFTPLAPVALTAMMVVAYTLSAVSSLISCAALYQRVKCTKLELGRKKLETEKLPVKTVAEKIKFHAAKKIENKRKVHRV